jgi:site-specific recombinase XerC
MTTLIDWLKNNHYRESTQRATLQGLAAAQAAFAESRALPDSAKPSASRVLAYARANPKARELDKAFVAWLNQQGLEQLTRLPKAAPKARVRQAISLDQNRWFRLHDALEKSAVPEDMVLFVVLRTGLRIGDVLRTPISTIERGLKNGVMDLERKGGRFKPVPIGDNEDAWRNLLKAAKKRGSTNVAHFLCRENASPLPGNCAYQRANRRIKFFQQRLRCSDSLHLHRLRRTIAVAALRETGGDLIKVQQMLGQEAISSTQRYTDELQVEGIAKLQSALFSRKKKGE